MNTISVYNTEGKEVDTLKLNSHVFDGTVNQDVIYQEINAYRANQRKGLAATKTRGEVSGGGKKPWRQKGTGRARIGSIRSPLWRHGGVIFGPHPRDYSFRLPRNIKNLALKSSLNAKLKENNIVVLDQLKVEKPKTKEMVRILSNLKLINNSSRKGTSILLLLEKIDNNLKLAVRNIGFLNINIAKNTHAYEVLAHNKIVIDKDGLNGLVNRLKK